MRKLLLSVLLIQVFLSSLILAKSDSDMDLLTRIFWDNLRYDGAVVDFFAVPPNYDKSTDVLSEDERAGVGYKGYWLEYWQNDNALLDWMGVTFYAGEEPPSYDMWIDWDSYYVDIWGDYFTELYYVGGESNPLAQSDYLGFWNDLTLNGIQIDPYQIPPNYDRSIDVWKDQRESIGYHWYWQHFLSADNQAGNDPHEINWKGVTFDPDIAPSNYDENKDIFCSLRGSYGYLEYWAAHFLKKSPDSLFRWYE